MKRISVVLLLLAMVVALLVASAIPAEAANTRRGKAVPWNEDVTAQLYSAPGVLGTGTVWGHNLKVDAVTYDGHDGYRYARLLDGRGYLRITLTFLAGAVKFFIW